MSDVVVVGAGPAGSAAALECARLGLGVTIVDRATFPRIKPCAGGLSPRASRILSALGLWDRVRARAYEVHGLRLITPSGRTFTTRDRATAWVLERRTLDEMLLDAAIGAGARFLARTRIDALVGTGGAVTGVRCGERFLPARWVIVANGAGSRLVRRAPASLLLHTCMAWFEGVAFEPHTVEMIYDKDLMPHYGWLFPESPTRVNIGICMEARRRRRPISEVFSTFLDRHFRDRQSGMTALGRWRGHPITASSRIGHLAPQGVLVAGEANRLVNPATCEGISYALESGALAARAIAEHPSDAARWYHARLLGSMQPSFLVSSIPLHGLRSFPRLASLL